MATLPAFIRRTGAEEEQGPTPQPVSARPVRDPYRLRALPLENVVFYQKTIDNTRLVREPDPKGRNACWSAIGTAGAVVVLLGAALAPSLAGTVAGYKLERLRSEERRLLDERRVLELRRAAIASPQNLERLARERGLMPPAPGQVTHLQGDADGALAMVKK